MTDNAFQPGDKVKHLFFHALRGEIKGKNFHPMPMWGATEQYIVEWEDGKRESMPVDNLVLRERYKRE